MRLLRRRARDAGLGEELPLALDEAAAHRPLDAEAIGKLLQAPRGRRAHHPLLLLDERRATERQRDQQPEVHADRQDEGDDQPPALHLRASPLGEGSAGGSAVVSLGLSTSAQ